MHEVSREPVCRNEDEDGDGIALAHSVCDGKLPREVTECQSVSAPSVGMLGEEVLGLPVVDLLVVQGEKKGWAKDCWQPD